MIRRISLNLVLGGLVAVLVTGCAITGRQKTLPEARPLGAQYQSAGQQSPQGGESMRPPSLPEGNLRVEQALAAALLLNPELMALSHKLGAAEARVLQAGVLPNPVIEFDVDEYDRGGEGFDSAETAIALAQAFELGGKRRWRKRIAEAEGELAGWDYESKRLDVFAETAQRFVKVLADQERVDLARSDVERSQKMSEAVGERVKAGKEPPLQASKSAAELEMARLKALAAENALGISRKSLAAMWGAETGAFDRAEGSLDYVLNAVPSLEDLRSKSEANPELARWDAELRIRRASLSSEKAARMPDLKVSVAYLQYEEDGTDALAFGVGMPLPLFDRNKGGVSAAAHELAKAGAERSAAEIGLATELAAAHAALIGAHQRVGALRDKVVPTVEQAYKAADEGYRQGKFGFLDMLDAQRGLFEGRAAFVDALYEYQAALIAIQRMTATPINELTNERQEN